MEPLLEGLLRSLGGSEADFLELCFGRFPYGNFHTKATSKKFRTPSGNFRPNPPQTSEKSLHELFQSGGWLENCLSIVDRGVDRRDPVCRHRFRFLEQHPTKSTINIASAKLGEVRILPFKGAQTMKCKLWTETPEFSRLKVPNSWFALLAVCSPSLIHGLCAFFASNSRFMRLFQAALDTPLDSPFSATLSVHGLHFTVCAPSNFPN